MYRGRFSDIGTAWAVAIALVLAFAIWPAIAEAPPQVLVKPLAVCEHSKCVMSQKDYETLQQFHSKVLERFGEMKDALAEQVQENAELPGMLARDAAGCKGRRT